MVGCPALPVTAGTGAWATFNWALGGHPIYMALASAGFVALIVAFNVPFSREEGIRAKKLRSQKALRSTRSESARGRRNYRTSHRCLHCEKVLGLSELP